MVEPVNVVAGGSLNREVNLNELCDDLAGVSDVSAEFAENAHWQLLIRFKEQEGMVILYRTGKYILRGGSSFDTLELAKERFIRLFTDIGIIESAAEITYSLQNIVSMENFEGKLDLAAVAVNLGLNNTEYEPEQFPGLIYRPDNFGVVMLLFASGKAIITGSTDINEIEEAVSSVGKQLRAATLLGS